MFHFHGPLAVLVITRFNFRKKNDQSDQSTLWN